MFSFAIITLVIGIREWFRKTTEYRTKLYFIAIQVSSSIWSAGFGLLIVQSNPDTAAVLRSIGMIGMFSFLIFTTFLLVSWAEPGKKITLYIDSFVLLAIPLYPFTVSSAAISFFTTRFGMSYELIPGFWNILYTLYTIVVAINMLVIIFNMIHKPRKRERIMGYGILLCEITIVLGMVTDTILPQLNYAAFPGSSIAQFLGALMCYWIYLIYLHTQITLENMSHFIYYSVNEPVLIYNEQQELKIVSSSAAQFFGESVKENSQIPLHEIFEISETLLNTEEDHLSLEAKCLCNNSYCKLWIDRIRDYYSDTLGFIIIVNDMTERLAAMEAMEEARRRADEANEAKSRFLANMSHEIRTPINAMLGMDEMILRESCTEDIKYYAQNIQNAGKTLLAIVNDILDLSKIESGMMDIVDNQYQLKDILTELTTDIMIRAKKKDLSLLTEFDPNMPSVLYGDEVRIRQIILNLLTNAVKYTESGKILFHVSWTELSDEEMMLDIFVKDTGIGIREENIKLLFDSFQRVEEKSVHKIEGTGLGLSIVKRLIELMHGSIHIKSLYGVGSIFTVHIPQKIIDREPLGDLQKSKNFLDRTNETPDNQYHASFEAPDAKLLVVDDYKLNLQVIQGLLKKTQVQLTLLQNPKTCLQKIQQERFDIIFLDHMMPEMDGITALHQMQEMPENINHDTPVIILTANAIIGAREMYLKEGFTDYLSKPIDSRLLEKIIIQYLPPEKIKLPNSKIT